MYRTILLALVCPFFLNACGDSRNPPPDPARQQQIARGEALFMEHCDRCHPRAGRGDYLKNIPATLLTRRSETDLANWIQGSDKHREMPNFTHLSEDEKRDLSSYLLSQIPRR